MRSNIIIVTFWLENTGGLTIADTDTWTGFGVTATDTGMLNTFSKYIKAHHMMGFFQ
jgi:hypothetical protein